MHSRRLLLLLCTFPIIIGTSSLNAQRDTLDIDGLDAQQQLIEDVIANSGDDSDEFTFNAAFSLLETYRRRPLDLNQANYDELAETLLLTPVQMDQLLEYRRRMGKLISIYELQVIPSLDVETIRNLRPFVRVGGGLDDTQISLGRMLAEGDRELYLRAQRRVEKARGYLIEPNDETNYYLGNPWRYYTKFRQRYGNRLSFGFVAEKDPGEAFFSANNSKRGFDYYSAHFFLRNVNRNIKALALGDFNVSFGQGLILYSGFGFGKSSQTTTVARGGQTLRPYASVNEISFQRGAGLTLAFGDKIEATVFGSRKGINGNRIETLTQIDTVEQEIFTANISSINLSGFNRTPSEVADRNAVTNYTFGGNLQFRGSQRFRIGLNVLGERFSQSLLRTPRPDNRFQFSGDRLYNASLDYRYRLRNFTFFGEVAGSDNGGTAMIHGVQAGLDRYFDIALVYRRYGRDYQALNARPFGETANGRNEEGIYLGVELRPANHWKVNAFYDLWRHPWLRFNIDAPSTGREYRFRLTYWQKRKLETYLEVRAETKGFGTDGDETVFTNLDPVVERSRFQARWHFGYKITSALEWRSRVDWGFTEDPLNGREEGVMVYQDFHFRPRGPFSFSTRFALFDTDSYNVRFYQYENGLLYNARVVPYYERGSRTFFVARYKGIRKLTLEARIAQTFFPDRESIGSGLEEIQGKKRTEIGSQIVWRF